MDSLQQIRMNINEAENLNFKGMEEIDSARLYQQHLN